jgi:hypothetical protein
MKFTNEAYNVLKQIALVWLPAAATLYVGIAALWGLGDVAQVVGTISGVDTFLGVVLRVSSASYSPVVDGTLNTSETDAKIIYGLELDTPPEKLAGKSSVTLKVVKQP